MCLDCNNRCRARAFSLVELLVVIAIIAVLAAMLLPTLATAKQRARTVSCVSNLRQTGITLQLYLADHGTFPLATTGDGLGNWQRALRTDGTNRILFCPQPVTASDQFLQYFPTNKLIFPHYGYNATGAVRRNPPPRNPGLGGDFIFAGGSGSYMAAKESWVAQPARMIAIGDSPTFVRPPFMLPDLAPGDPIYIAFPYVLQPQGYVGVAKLHNQGANMLFCDGHVQFARQSVWLDLGDESKRQWNADGESHPAFQ